MIREGLDYPVKVPMAAEGENFNFPSLASKAAVCQIQEMIITTETVLYTRKKH
jgi:hypothetical protein